jgi:hypothetical protein
VQAPFFLKYADKSHSPSSKDSGSSADADGCVAGVIAVTVAVQLYQATAIGYHAPVMEEKE